MAGPHLGDEVAVLLAKFLPDDAGQAQGRIEAGRGGQGGKLLGQHGAQDVFHRGLAVGTGDANHRQAACAVLVQDV